MGADCSWSILWTLVLENQVQFPLTQKLVDEQTTYNLARLASIPFGVLSCSSRQPLFQ